jgi:hypothetical protein
MENTSDAQGKIIISFKQHISSTTGFPTQLGQTDVMGNE